MLKRSIILIIALVLPVILQANQLAEDNDFKISFQGYPDIAACYRAITYQEASDIIITLSDGSSWIVRDPDLEAKFNEVSSYWHCGDEVRIAPREIGKNKGHYVLKNVRNKRVCLVDFDKSSDKEKHGNQILTMDKNGYTLFTTNGMEWAIGWVGSFTTKKWHIGDRILINKSIYSRREDYLLINVDQDTYVWASLVLWK